MSGDTGSDSTAGGAGTDHAVAHLLERRVRETAADIDAWLVEKRRSIRPALYGSFDVRDAGWKVATVDANAFPAGFNNPPAADRARLGALLARYLASQHPEAKRLLLLPEANTRNIGYAENVRILASLLASDGREVLIGAPRLNGVERLVGIEASSPLVEVDLGDGVAKANGEAVDLVILNDDLTVGALPELETPVLPSPRLGWYNRRKSDHFAALQPLLDELAEILGLDPWLLCTHWFVSLDKCLDRDTCRRELAAEVDQCLSVIGEKYVEHGIDAEPSMFIKSDRGTYGLGILRINNGSELLDLSKRRMNRLTYGKGGSDVDDFLLQESVPTALRNGAAVLEPCGYAAAGETIAWFMRANMKRGEVDNLNTPSTTFIHTDDLDAAASLQVGRRAPLHRLLADVAALAVACEQVETAEP